MLDEITQREIEPYVRGLIKALEDDAKFAKIGYKIKFLGQGYSETEAEELSTQFAILRTAQKLVKVQKRLPKGINLLEYIKS